MNIWYLELAMTSINTNIAPFSNLGGQGLVARFHDWNARRQTRNALSTLTADQLEDIGLTKADLHDMFLIRG